MDMAEPAAALVAGLHEQAHGGVKSRSGSGAMRVRAVILAAAFVLAPLGAEAETVVRWTTPEPAVTWDPHGADVSYTIQMVCSQRTNSA
jgi:hypothetical protein